MLKSQSNISDYNLPKDKLPECNLFTLFLRKQTQSSAEYTFERKGSVKKEIKRDQSKTNVQQRQINIQQTSVIKKAQDKSATPDRNATKKKQIVYSNMKKTPYHHLSVNIIDSIEGVQKSQNKLSCSKSRKKSLSGKEVSNIVGNHTNTQRSQSNKSRRSSISAALAHDHTYRTILQQNNQNLYQSKSICTEQTTQHSLERSNSQFKAKKMPNFAIPFIVYKSNKPLTVFQEFTFAPIERSSSGQRNNSCNSNYVTNIKGQNTNNVKKHNQSVSIYEQNDKENSDNNFVRPQSSMSKSSQRTYFNENVNYQNNQQYLLQQNNNFNQQEVPSFNKVKGYNYQQNENLTNQQSEMKNRTNIKQIPKYLKSRQYA